MRHSLNSLKGETQGVVGSGSKLFKGRIVGFKITAHITLRVQGYRVSQMDLENQISLRGTTHG